MSTLRGFCHYFLCHYVLRVGGSHREMTNVIFFAVFFKSSLIYTIASDYCFGYGWKMAGFIFLLLGTVYLYLLILSISACLNCVWRRTGPLLRARKAPKPLLQHFLRLGPALGHFFHPRRPIFHPRIWLNSITSWDSGKVAPFVSVTYYIQNIYLLSDAIFG